MARVDDGVVRQGPKLFPYTFQQGVMVTAGEVGTPDAAPEKDVSADEEALGRAVKTHAAG